jgi:ElaB/YqjD/DUF883 family membrane-anchored ribosome-binding protein
MATSNGAESAQQVDANEAKREVYARAEEIRKEAAKKLNTAAENIRKEVRENDVDPEAIAKADEIAAHLEKTAQYLNDHSLEQMGQDATEAVQNNPWQAVLIAFVIGFIVAMLLRRR